MGSTDLVTSRAAVRSVVVIGASAGGPRALQTVLPGLPPSFAAPVIVIQHFSRDLFDSWMQTLSKICHLAVETAADGPLRAGAITVCPPDHQYTVSTRGGALRGRLVPDTASTYRPCIDVTMTSVAEACGPGAIGVLLTGIGADGVEGLRRIVEAGGLSLVESEETAAVFGMPRAAAQAGVAQRVLPLHQIASELIMTPQLRESARPTPSPGDSDPDSSLQALSAERLGARGDRAAVAELVRRLGADQPIVVETAKSALQSLPGRVVLPDLLPLLRAGEPVVRATAVDVAKRVSLDASEAIELLAALCNDDDDDIRLFTLDIVSAHHPSALLDVVLARCDDPNTNVAIMAIKALAGYEAPRAVARLVQELESEPTKRSAAITALGRSPAPEATAHLEALDSHSFEDQYMWLHAIAGRNDAAAVTAVLARLDALQPELLSAALAALAQLTRDAGDQLSPSALAQLRSLPFQAFLENGRESVRLAAIGLIGAVGSDKHLTTLVERLDAMTRNERRLALESVAEIPGEAAAGVLVILSESDDPAVAAEALEFLRGV